MSFKIDFHRFKTEIDFIHFASHYGYKIDRQKSTKQSVCMGLDNRDKIIISKRNGKWVYFSVHDDQDNGTIIDFVIKRTGKSIFEVGQELSSWTAQSVVLDNSIKVEEQQPDPKRIQRLFSYCSILRNHPYLNERGLKEEVLNSSRFNKRIYTDRFNNVVFPHFKNHQVCGLELKNKNIGLFVKGSEKTLWRSNVFRSDHTLALSETPIDAISYQALFQLKNVFYVATSGSPSPAQLEFIKQLLNLHFNIQEVKIITDNDTGGDRLSKLFEDVIFESGFKGQVLRDSPKQRGGDWNEVLVPYHY